ncbi:hypothetical protein [Jatrophihabitans sp.]|uniref:glycine-rich domain-containing protein n=1 Tax=Jatrophihabitans sp. TaxID=1932789 RepID=UPI0030C6FDF0|nr:tail protein [Jatrophihabitans sp.]
MSSSRVEERVPLLRRFGRAARHRPVQEADGSEAAGIGRRTLLGGGIVLATGGVAGAVLSGGRPATGAVSVSVSTVMAPAPSGGDDTAALQDALPAQGVLYLQPGTYLLGSQLVVGGGQDLLGAGGGYGRSATVLRCTTADAGVTISAGGGITSGFRVDGNGVATQPLLRNGGIGSWVGRTFQGLTVVNAAQDGIVCLGCQNDAWYNVVSASHVRDAWVIDQGYGGALFSRCEFAAAGRYNLRIDSALTGGPYATPSNHVFHQCIIEYTAATSAGLVWINGGGRIKFDHTAFYASVAPSGALISLTGQATDILIEDALIQSTPATQGGIGIRLDTGCQLICSGFTSFQNLATPIYLAAGRPTVEVRGLFQYSNCGSRYGAAAGIDPQSSITTTQSELLAFARRSAGDLSYASLNPSGGYYTYESAAGRKVWGSGNDYVGDVALSRRDVGVLGVDKLQLLASGYGSTATRPAVTGLMAGAIRYNTDSRQLEVTDGGAWHAPSERSKSFAVSATFVVPAGVTLMRCQAFGGGGGGGGGGNIGLLTLTGTCYGGGGGGAGMTMDTPITVTPGSTLTVLIGAGGAGGAGALASLGLNGNAGQNGVAGGTTGITNAAGTVLINAPGGGGGGAGPGATVLGAVAPAGGGAFGCPDLSQSLAAPGCGSSAGWNAIPTLNGLSGGASGASSSPARGGGSGSGSLAQGQRAVAGASTNLTPNGSVGARSSTLACGGNGGGAGGSGGTSGAGGAGTSGALLLLWVS